LIGGGFDFGELGSFGVGGFGREVEGEKLLVFASAFPGEKKSNEKIT